jgi:3-deoxy-D-manno-octulosonic-acid transferase
MWWVYEALLVVALVAYLPKALWRRRLPHRGWRMRLGRYPASIHESLRGARPIWVHAVSVGEVSAARPLVDALAARAPGEPLVLSTITPGGFDVASKHLGDRGVAIYFPLDVRRCVRRALDALHPRALLLLESELWPTAVRLTQARGIPIVIVNGRVSMRTYRRAQRLIPWLGGLLRYVDLFLMQSETDADRIIRLGALPASVQVTGNLKWEASLAARPAPAMVEETAGWLGLNGQERLIVGGSTHRGEEAELLRALQALRASHGSVRLLLAPRHLERLAEVEGLVQQAGFSSRRLSHAPRGARWDVGLVDTFGQLPRYYGLASAVFIGGSLIPHGGQNPLEAASLGKPIVFGPSMHNFTDIASQLTSHQAARQLSGAAQLLPALRGLLQDPASAHAMGRRAQELTERSRGALQRTLEALRPLIAASSSTT